MDRGVEGFGRITDLALAGEENQDVARCLCSEFVDRIAHGIQRITVLLECVVLPDGTVGPVEVVRSLDSSFGLDQEAVRAAKQWRFRPGTRFGEPVSVLVTIELTFTLR